MPKAHPKGQKLTYSSLSTSQFLPYFNGTRPEMGEIIMGTEGTIEITVGDDVHPAVAWWDGAGSSLKLPAVVVSSERIVLPAFSPWAAGTPWTPAPEGTETLWAVANTRIFALPRGRAHPKLAAP